MTKAEKEAMIKYLEKQLEKDDTIESPHERIGFLRATIKYGVIEMLR